MIEPLRNVMQMVRPEEIISIERDENGTKPAMGFFTDTTLCIGCKACEVACKQWNQLPSDGYNFTGNSYDNTSHLSETTWRHVAFVEQIDSERKRESSRWLMMSDVCKHCVEAPCQEACPTGSIIYNEFGNVYVQPDICNGCGYCVTACPFGVLGRSDHDGHAHKCTLCYDRQRATCSPPAPKPARPPASSSGRSRNCATGKTARGRPARARRNGSVSVWRRSHGRVQSAQRLLPAHRPPQRLQSARSAQKSHDGHDAAVWVEPAGGRRPHRAFRRRVCKRRA